MTRQTKKRVPDIKNPSAQIIVPKDNEDFTYGDHLRHLAEHAGTVPATLDEFGRCLHCVRRGWFRFDA
jgi:hypothetical protein